MCNCTPFKAVGLNSSYITNSLCDSVLFNKGIALQQVHTGNAEQWVDCFLELVSHMKLKGVLLSKFIVNKWITDTWITMTR